jgi:TetR/AcrR family fatty acid metabolism transcriptional regulator
LRTKTPFLAEKMLDAAGRLFGGRRFHEVRMEDIATEAEVSKGTLYRYFQDKEEMFLALLERASHQLVKELHTRVGEAEGGRARLVAVVDAVITFFDRQMHLFDLIQRAEIGHEQGRRFPWQEVRDKGMRIVLDIFDDARKAGEFTIRDPQTAMLMLLGGMRAVIRTGPRPRPRDLAERIVADYLNGAVTSTAQKRLARSI